MVPEPDHAYARPAEVSVAYRVPRSVVSLGMVPTVKLDSQPGLSTEEVEHVGAKDSLPTELRATKLAVADQ